MIFKNIEPGVREKLIGRVYTHKKTLSKGEVLYSEHDTCNSIAIIARGSIMATEIFSDGHEKVIRIIEENEIIGISLIFSTNPLYKATFVATSDTLVYIIYKDELLALMNENSKVLSNVLAIISDYSNNLSSHIKLLSYKTIKQKLCAYLYSEYERNNNVTFIIPYTKKDLASYLNVERPSLSFELSKLIDDGVISNQNKQYTILNLNELLKNI